MERFVNSYISSVDTARTFPNRSKMKNQTKRSILVLQVGDLGSELTLHRKTRKTTNAIKSQLKGMMLSTPPRQGQMYTYTGRFWRF